MEHVLFHYDKWATIRNMLAEEVRLEVYKVKVMELMLENEDYWRTTSGYIRNIIVAKEIKDRQ